MTYGARLRVLAAFGLLCGVAWLATLYLLSPVRDGQRVQGDGYYSWLWARSIVLDHDVDFERDYGQCGDPWEFQHSPHADSLNQWNPGPALFWIPFFLYDVVRDDPALRGESRFTSACSGMLANRAVRGSWVAGALAFWLAYLAARRLAGPGAAVFGALGALCTPVLYYATMLLSYGHAASACTSGLAVWVWLRATERPTRNAWPAMGAAIGLAMLTRPQNAVLAILPFCLWIELARPLVRERHARSLALHVGRGVLFVAAVLLVFSPQIAFWWDQYGELFFVPQGEHYMRWGAPRIALVLFSSCVGLFQWSPIVYLALAGWVWMALRSDTRRVGLPLVLLFAMVTYASACTMDWWGAIGYPGRRFDALTVPFAIGLAFVAQRAARAEWLRLSGLAPVLGTITILVLGYTTSVTCFAIGSGTRLDRPMGSEAVFPAFTREVGRALEARMGDPLTWPASLPFAMYYGVHPSAWRWASQPELFRHAWLTMAQENSTSTFDFVDAEAPLLVGFGPIVTRQSTDGEAEEAAEPERMRVLAGCARALVPISWPEIGALRFIVVNEADAPAFLWVELGGESLETSTIAPGRLELTRPVTGLHEGIVQMRMCTTTPVGIETMVFVDRDPSPAEIEREHNAELRERRHRWRRAHGR